MLQCHHYFCSKNKNPRIKDIFSKAFNPFKITAGSSFDAGNSLSRWKQSCLREWTVKQNSQLLCPLTSWRKVMMLQSLILFPTFQQLILIMTPPPPPPTLQPLTLKETLTTSNADLFYSSQTLDSTPFLLEVLDFAVCCNSSSSHSYNLINSWDLK